MSEPARKIKLVHHATCDQIKLRTRIFLQFPREWRPNWRESPLIDQHTGQELNEFGSRLKIGSDSGEKGQ